MCPARPSFTPADSPSQTNWFAKVQAASPACFAYRTLPGDTIKSGQANRGAQQGLAGSKSKLHTPSPQSGLKGHCVSGKIVSGYNPLLKVTIFQQHLTHTHTNWDWRGEKTGGCIVLYIVLARFTSCGHQQLTHTASVLKFTLIHGFSLPWKSASSLPGRQGQPRLLCIPFVPSPSLPSLVASFLNDSWYCYHWCAAIELSSWSFPLLHSDVCLAFGSKTLRTHQAQDLECASESACAQALRSQSQVLFCAACEDPGERCSQASGHKAIKEAATTAYPLCCLFYLSKYF